MRCTRCLYGLSIGSFLHCSLARSPNVAIDISSHPPLLNREAYDRVVRIAAIKVREQTRNLDAELARVREWRNRVEAKMSLAPKVNSISREAQIIPDALLCGTRIRKTYLVTKIHLATCKRAVAEQIPSVSVM